ncbi:hypothetical protein GLYMA_13G329551v4 [Glycine max]|nr:hypothetical protein GLYMA_13G329551v4 [Glycine max]KAH1104573.1 hypothetical protein GYH30_038121 [Glycine max]
MASFLAIVFLCFPTSLEKIERKQNVQDKHFLYIKKSIRVLKHDEVELAS